MPALRPSPSLATPRPQRRSAIGPQRRRAALCGIALLLALLLGRAADLAVRQHGQFASMAEDNLQADRSIPALRGRLFDRNGVILADNRRAYAVSATAHRVGKEAVATSLETVHRLLERPALSPSDTTLLVAAMAARKQEIASNQRQENILALLERIRELPGISVTETFLRDYPFGSATALLLGFARPKDGFPSRIEGRSGLEARLEPLLAGTPGLERIHRDARGRALGEPERLRESIPGADVTLTIDAAWQRHAHALLAASTGSLVVVEAHSGAVRVMAGSPSFIPDRPGAPLPDGRPASQLNRPARAAMPPGSVVKPFVALAGYRAGIDPAREVRCSGSVRLAGWLRPFHCNVRSGHGPVALSQSLQVSCNVYYFDLVQRIGVARVLEELRRFGFGTATGCGVPGEASGQPAGEAEPNDGEALNLSIGQGRMLATPLQVARAYAALANGTELPGLHVVQGALRANGTPVEVPPGPRQPVAIPAEARAAIIEGLYRAVNAPGGTARRAGFPSRWRLCGKTGTVENAQGTSDAWFAGFYPRENPRHVIVVQVEDVEGHGGEIAAPIARAMIAFMEGEEGSPPLSAHGPSDAGTEPGT